MEPRFSRDFSQVRVHNDAKAAASAAAINARAYTIGDSIVFGDGAYAPGTFEGRTLIAHELTHTLQQRESAWLQAKPLLSGPQGADEQEADSVAAAVMSGKALPSISATPAARLQRACVDLVPPPAISCQIAVSSPPSSATFVEFGQDTPILTPAAQATLQAIAAVWNAGSRTDILRIDGFASIDGAESHNCPLSCDRANAVAAELNAPTNGDPGIPTTNLNIFAQGETDQFSSSLPPNRRVVISGAGGGPAPTETITSQTVAVSPALRTRTTVGVGEQVTLTHVPGSAAWATTGGSLSAANGITVILTAPDTAQRITVTAGAATISFDVLAPTSVAMDRQPGTGVKHTLNRPDSGIQTRVFLGPDTVNFSRVRYRELDTNSTASGTYSCHAGVGHCGAGGGGAACPDKALTSTVVAGVGTQSVLGDCAYSGHCGGTPPFVPGNIMFNIPYEYRVPPSATFHNITNVIQLHTLLPLGILTTAKAGATGVTTVASPTVAIAQCP